MRAFMVMVAVLAGSVTGVGVAHAADNPMQLCGARYQAAKAAKTLPAGQTWPQFLAACRATLPKTPAPIAVVKPSTSAPGKMASAAVKDAARPAAGQPSAAQLAARSRQKQCAQDYRADKAANKLAGQGWPQYYSACSKRLKG